MTREQQEDAIQRKLKLRKYPRRGEDGIEFNEENDHNPIVLADCPGCHGTGKCSRTTVKQGAIVHEYFCCPQCEGSGTNEEPEPYFANNAPAIEVSLDDKGWLTCPYCTWRFSIKDTNVWTGLRHMRCGQKISVAGMLAA